MNPSGSDAARDLYWYIYKEETNVPYDAYEFLHVHHALNLDPPDIPHASVDRVRDLVQRQGDTECYRCPIRGNTAVFLAAAYGNTEVLEYLSTVPQYQRECPGAWARVLYEYVRVAGNPSVDRVRDLAQRQGDAEPYRQHGKGAVSLAAYCGNTEVLGYLLALPSHYNDINHPDCYEASMPMHYAARNGYLGSVRSLLQHGATLNHRNKHGKTPLDLAREKDKQNVVELLENPPPPLHWSKKLHLGAGLRVRRAVVCVLTLGCLKPGAGEEPKPRGPFAKFVCGANRLLLFHILEFLPYSNHLYMAGPKSWPAVAPMAVADPEAVPREGGAPDAKRRRFD